MIDGHPFETRSLDEQRARQRLMLRMIPDWIMTRLAPSEATANAEQVGPDRAYVETLLRARADAIAETLADFDLLAPFAAQEATARLAQFFAHEAETLSADQRMPREQLVDAAFDARKAAGTPKTDIGPWRADLGGLIILLVWADAMASDGYSDPRVPQQPVGPA
jgi:hypothetical protein